jgi:hypothetical protein
MRDQLAVQSLQLRHTRELLKNLQEQVHIQDTEHQKEMTAMKKELEDGIRLAGVCANTTKLTETNVTDLNNKVHNLVHKLNEETQQRDVAVQDITFKMVDQKKTQSHETAKLAEEMGARLQILQDADERIFHDLDCFQKKCESITDLVNARHEEALQHLADERVSTLHAISQSSSDTLEQAHKEIEPQLNTLTAATSALETRIIKFSTLSNDTSNRFLTSHDQMQEQYNSISQTVEQCRLQARTTNVALQEIKERFGVHTESMQEKDKAMKDQQYRERKAFEEQLRTMQQSLEGTLKSSLTELESKVFSRVDREAATRTASIAKALDDTGTVLEKKMHPSNLRSKESRSRIETEESIPSGASISGSTLKVQRRPHSATGYKTPRQATPIATTILASPVGYQMQQSPSFTWGKVQQGGSVSVPGQGGAMFGSRSATSIMGA